MLLLSLKNDAEQTSTYFTFTPTLSNFGTVLSQRGTDLTSVDFKTARPDQHRELRWRGARLAASSASRPPTPQADGSSRGRTT